MATATWNGVVIAEAPTEECKNVEGNIYFPPSALQMEHFTKSEHRTTCPWKGEASYYNITVSDQVNENAAWYYPEPKEAAAEIKGYVAFWKGVTVTE